MRWRDWSPEANPGTFQFPPPLAAVPVKGDIEPAHRQKLTSTTDNVLASASATRPVVPERATNVPDAGVSHGQRGCLTVELTIASRGIEIAGQSQDSPASLPKRGSQVRILPGAPHRRRTPGGGSRSTFGSRGDRLPSRAQIGQECGVGENVVRRAQELLISQGVLEGRAGSGTYVAEPRKRVRVVRSSAREQPQGSPFRADMKALGRQGDWESRTDAKVPAPAEIAARLGVAEGELCVRTVYEFLADGRPVQLSTSWSRTTSPPALSSSSPREGRTPGRVS